MIVGKEIGQSMSEDQSKDVRFPDHVCMLAREDNPDRCGDVRQSDPERCLKCKTTMQHLMWEALYSGEWSLAAFLLPSHMDELGVEIEFYAHPGYYPTSPILNLWLKVQLPDGSAAELCITPRDEKDYTVGDFGYEDKDETQKNFTSIEDAYDFFHVRHAMRIAEISNPVDG